MSTFDPLYQSDNVNCKIVVALEKISETFRVLLWNHAKNQELSPIQLQLLVFLKFHPDEARRKVAALSKEFNLSKPTISDSVKTLERKGLICRTIDDDDARSNTLHLTPKGLELTTSVENYSAPLDGAVSALSEKERALLFLSILHITYDLGEAGIISGQRMCFRCKWYTGDKKSQHYCQRWQKEMMQHDLQVECPEFSK